MEASGTSPEPITQTGTGTDDDPITGIPQEEHQPLAESDQHGTVDPKSAPPASTQSGDPLDDATKRGIAGRPPAQGEATPAA